MNELIMMIQWNRFCDYPLNSAQNNTRETNICTAHSNEWNFENVWRISSTNQKSVIWLLNKFIITFWPEFVHPIHFLLSIFYLCSNLIMLNAPKNIHTQLPPKCLLTKLKTRALSSQHCAHLRSAAKKKKINWKHPTDYRTHEKKNVVENGVSRNTQRGKKKYRLRGNVRIMKLTAHIFIKIGGKQWKRQKVKTRAHTQPILSVVGICSLAGLFYWIKQKHQICIADRSICYRQSK